jgi:hypothetical protein
MQSLYTIKIAYGHWEDYKEVPVFATADAETAHKRFDEAVERATARVNEIFYTYTAYGECPSAVLDRSTFLSMVEYAYDYYGDDNVTLLMEEMPFNQLCGDQARVVKRERIVKNPHEVDFMNDPQYSTMEDREEELRWVVEEELRKLKGWD